MNCLHASPFLSALYDGERVPEAVADHAYQCPHCRAQLRDYSEMGLQLKLLAQRETAPASLPGGWPPASPRRRRSWNAFLAQRVLVPRFALGALALALAVFVPAGWNGLHAQNAAPLWFQFQFAAQPLDPREAVHAVRAGTEESWFLMIVDDPAHLPRLRTIGFKCRVDEVAPNQVKLQIAMRDFGLDSGQGSRTNQALLDQARFETFVYHPGEDLNLTVNSRHFTLRGSVLDHQPKLNLSVPVEPGPDDLAMANPILLDDHRVLANLHGFSGITDGGKQAITIAVSGVGKFRFALRPMLGAVEGRIDWAQLTFDMDGEHFVLTNGSFLSGGPQPRKVWVTLERNLAQAAISAGSEPLPN